MNLYLPCIRNSTQVAAVFNCNSNVADMLKMQRETVPMQRNHPFKRRLANNTANDSNACFRRGSYIELSTGVLRRVEDIRTEDFIQSALRSHLFNLREATVVKIDRSCGDIINISFSFDTQHLKVDMEVQPGHPLFVYGQGWASCNPQLSFELYELKCQQLQVGDICLSLVKQEQPPPPVHLSESYQAMPSSGGFYGLDANCPPYRGYAEMANIVAAYTQHLIEKMKMN